MRTRIFLSRSLLGALLFLALASPATRADLVYESLNGASLIYDTATNITWTQDGNLSGTAYLNQSDAQAWATGLTTAGLTWSLPTASAFTSLYTQLDPYGPPGTTSNKYGPQVYFGPGPNDYASNVETTYWTNASGTDFNFNYGYQGAATAGTAYYAWAASVNGPIIPEPASILMVLTGIVGFGMIQRTQLRRNRLGKSIA